MGHYLCRIIYVFKYPINLNLTNKITMIMMKNLLIRLSIRIKPNTSSQNKKLLSKQSHFGDYLSKLLLVIFFTMH